MERFISIFGLLVFLGVAWLLSSNRGAISKRIFGNPGFRQPDGADGQHDGQPDTIAQQDTQGVRIERAANIKDLRLYIERIEELPERKRNLFAR